MLTSSRFTMTRPWRSAPKSSSIIASSPRTTTAWSWPSCCCSWRIRSTPSPRVLLDHNAVSPTSNTAILNHRDTLHCRPARQPVLRLPYSRRSTFLPSVCCVSLWLIQTPRDLPHRRLTRMGCDLLDGRLDLGAAGDVGVFERRREGHGSVRGADDLDWCLQRVERVLGDQ